ncbi:MAG: porphobilinogen synthase, partial [Blastopirellula sp. JB062]
MSSSFGSFPQTRLRRNRRFDWSRRLVRENQLSVDDLIWPLFVQPGDALRTPINSLPGVERLSIDLIVEQAGQAESLGIPVIAIFPATPSALKTVEAEEAVNPDNLVCQTVKAIKQAYPN